MTQRAIPAKVHRWSRRIRVKNPPRARPETVVVGEQLPAVMQRLEVYIPGGVPTVDLSRITLTRFQTALRELTERDPRVATDQIIQGFRKTLHLALDH